MTDHNVSGDLIRGNIDTIILSVLYEGDHYGYEIIKAIRIKSGGEYELREPTLYSSLRRLESQGKITSYWGDESQGARRKYYKITPQGIDLYRGNKQAWREARSLIDRLIVSEREETL